MKNRILFFTYLIFSLGLSVLPAATYIDPLKDAQLQNDLDANGHGLNNVLHLTLASGGSVRNQANTAGLDDNGVFGNGSRLTGIPYSAITGGPSGGSANVTGLRYSTGAGSTDVAATGAQVSALVTGAINPSSIGATTPMPVTFTTLGFAGVLTKNGPALTGEMQFVDSAGNIRGRLDMTSATWKTFGGFAFYGTSKSFSGNGLDLLPTDSIKWRDGNYGTLDVGLARLSSGALVLTDGGSDYGSLLLSSLNATSGISANSLFLSAADIGTNLQPDDNGNLLINAGGVVTSGNGNSFDNGAITTDGSGDITANTISAKLIGTGAYSSSLDNGSITTNGFGGLSAGSFSTTGTITAGNGGFATDSFGNVTLSGLGGLLSAEGITSTGGLGVVGNTSLDNGAITTDGNGTLSVSTQININGNNIIPSDNGWSLISNYGGGTINTTDGGSIDTSNNGFYPSGSIQTNGQGNPNGHIYGPKGSIYMDTDPTNASGHTLWVKESVGSSTGWVGK